MVEKISLADELAASLPAPAPAADAEQVTQRQTGDVLEARSTSRVIRTVEDLLKHIDADMSRFELAQSEATKWESSSVDRKTGRPVVTELFRVFVRLKPRPGPGVREAVESMIAAAKKEIRRPARPKVKAPKPSDRWVVLVVADTHLAKYAWHRTTGDRDYDLNIAERVIGQAADELLEVADRYKPGRLTVAMLGDLFHYDNPGGSTTSGTPLERDGRLQKMIEVGWRTLIGVVEKAADTARTDVTIVPGNHDTTLTWAFHRMLLERYAKDKRVLVDDAYTSRKYASTGQTLLGFSHGNHAKKKLPQLMAIEAAQQWAACPYREIHTGHLHHQAAEWSRPIETIDGVLVRVAPSLGPADDYHAEQGWVHNRQAMELFVYSGAGGLEAMHVAGPRIGGGP
jgi:hypothetical protein